ncbi:DUF4625 domain-containing protein [uncultured Draconibacterium sp.]|uniref:DUF4625 domain-containing protein n=1 Tax=uncultured Draconibacterium sp. TaxID=1573823 RepID=UPI0032616180
MSLKIILSRFAFIVLLATACSDDGQIDKEKPVIDNSFANAFPTNCDTIYFGEAFNLKLLFSDNVELGSYSIDIHNNFDHHSHSTEVAECSLSPKKDPENPFVFIDDYSIPEGLKDYKTNMSVSIPADNQVGLFDEGDYHFFVSLTDKEGWSTQMGLSIKIKYR